VIAAALLTPATATAESGAVVMCRAHGALGAHVAPRACTFAGGGHRYRLTGLRWTNWGARTVTATGRAHGNVPATIHLSRLRRCGAERRYTRFTMTTIASTARIHVRLPGCQVQTNRGEPTQS
jgi:hypothetical protein